MKAAVILLALVAGAAAAAPQAAQYNIIHDPYIPMSNASNGWTLYKQCDGSW